MENRTKLSGGGSRTTRNWEAALACRSWREKKRTKLSGKNWEAMDPLALGLIFACIPTDAMVRTVPLVCRSWRKSLDWPNPWTKIDLRPWLLRARGNHSDIVRTTTFMHINNFCYFFLVSVKVPCSDDACFYSAHRTGRMLKVLKMPSSQISDRAVRKCEEFLFPNLTTLDISCCMKITSKGIEMFGKHAKRLVKLRRNMARPNSNGLSNGLVKVDESEAMAVAHSMPGLQHLELQFGFFTHRGLDLILTNCKALGYLDILGCWNVKLDEKMLDEKIKESCERIFFFRDPHDEGKGKMKTDDD